MEEQIRVFLDYLQQQKGYAPNTIQAYRNDLNQLLNFAQVEKPHLTHWSRVDQHLLATFLAHLADHAYTSASISRKVAVIKTFFQFLHRRKAVPQDTAALLPAPKVEKKTPQILSSEEIERLVDYDDRDETPKVLRDRAIVELLAASGMRVTELVSLDLKDVDLQTGSVACGDSWSNRREIPLSQRVIDAVERYLQKGRSGFAPASDEKALFVNPQGGRLSRQGLWLVIKERVRRAGIETPVTPHTLRHSFAVNLLNRGEDLSLVQRWLGHSHVTTTQNYVRIAERTASARNGSEVQK